MLFLFLIIAFLLAFTSIYTRGIPRNIIQLAANLFLVLYFWLQGDETLFAIIGCSLFTLSTIYKVVEELKEERTNRKNEKTTN